MRVIAGKYRGLKINSPENNNARPTSDRIKETMFNILTCNYAVEGTRVLDLFSGSGALGMEALSRGAKEVIFTDVDSESIRLTKENLSKTRADNYKVYIADYALALKKLNGTQFDLVLLDPPYNFKLEEKVFPLLVKYNLLAGSGVVVFEHSSDLIPPHIPEFDTDSRKYGNITLSFYTHNNGGKNE